MQTITNIAHWQGAGIFLHGTPINSDELTPYYSYQILFPRVKWPFGVDWVLWRSNLFLHYENILVQNYDKTFVCKCNHVPSKNHCRDLAVWNIQQPYQVQYLKQHLKCTESGGAHKRTPRFWPRVSRSLMLWSWHIKMTFKLVTKQKHTKPNWKYRPNIYWGLESEKKEIREHIFLVST